MVSFGPIVVMYQPLDLLIAIGFVWLNIILLSRFRERTTTLTWKNAIPLAIILTYLTPLFFWNGMSATAIVLVGVSAIEWVSVSIILIRVEKAKVLVASQIIVASDLKESQKELADTLLIEEGDSSAKKETALKLLQSQRELAIRLLEAQKVMAMTLIGKNKDE